MTAISQLDCSSSTVANLVAPPEDSGTVTDVADDRTDVTDVVTPQDDGVTMRDVPVANLIPPPDVVQPQDVVEPQDDLFSVAIIPFTWEHTNFRNIAVGDAVNTEFDLIGKYISRYLALYK